MPEAHLLAARAEAKAAAEVAHKHKAEVGRLRAELDSLNRQLEQTCTLRLQPSDALDSQVLHLTPQQPVQDRSLRPACLRIQAIIPLSIGLVGTLGL